MALTQIGRLRQLRFLRVRSNDSFRQAVGTLRRVGCTFDTRSHRYFAMGVSTSPLRMKGSRSCSRPMGLIGRTQILRNATGLP